MDGCENGPEMMVSEASLEAETELAWNKSCDSVLGNSETFSNPKRTQNLSLKFLVTLLIVFVMHLILFIRIRPRKTINL